MADTWQALRDRGGCVAFGKSWQQLSMWVQCQKKSSPEFFLVINVVF